MTACHTPDEIKSPAVSAPDVQVYRKLPNHKLLLQLEPPLGGEAVERRVSRLLCY